jgi:TPR repeat protein
MIPVYSTWFAAHGRLWYEHGWYRLAWVVWPQALGVVMIMLLWAMPPSAGNVPWAKPMDGAARAQQLQALRDTAKSNQSAMDALERDARAGEMEAQFYYATLFDPEFKLSTIVKPDVGKAIDWYSLAARQGEQMALNNLVLIFWSGIYTRADHTRACFYARKLNSNVSGGALSAKGDCYARGLGGTPIDMEQAVNAYEAATNKGNPHAAAALGYFYENGVGGKPRSNEMALKYYRVAADRGEPLGLHNLGAAYNVGSLGLQRDGNEAARLIFHALENKYEVTVQSLTTRPEYWSSDFWANLQRRLAERGLYSGMIDGRPNAATLDAVKRLARV